MMMMSADEKAKLDFLRTEAFAHAGIAPNVIDDDYVRHAIYETSKIEVPSAAPSPSAAPPPPWLSTA